jgi:hypothetical protein
MEIHIVTQKLADRVQQAWKQREIPERFGIDMCPKCEPDGVRVIFLRNHLRAPATEDLRHHPLQDPYLIFLQ